MTDLTRAQELAILRAQCSDAAVRATAVEAALAADRPNFLLVIELLGEAQAALKAAERDVELFLNRARTREHEE